MLSGWPIRYSILFLIIVHPQGIVWYIWAWSFFVELLVMVYCTCYSVDSWNKFLYPCYLFLLHGIHVTQLFLFIYFSYLLDTCLYRYTHDYSIQHLGVLPVCLLFVRIIWGVIYTYQTMPTDTLLQYKSLEMGRHDDWLDLIRWVSWIHRHLTAGGW